LPRTGESGRFRKFSRQWIAERDESLDIAWPKDDNAESSADLPELAVLKWVRLREVLAKPEERSNVA